MAHGYPGEKLRKKFITEQQDRYCMYFEWALSLRDSVTMQSKLNDAHNAHGPVCLSLIKALQDII